MVGQARVQPGKDKYPNKNHGLGRWSPFKTKVQQFLSGSLGLASHYWKYGRLKATHACLVLSNLAVEAVPRAAARFPALRGFPN